jgi:hypothetical protein
MVCRTGLTAAPQKDLEQPRELHITLLREVLKLEPHNKVHFPCRVAARRWRNLLNRD